MILKAKIMKRSIKICVKITGLLLLLLPTFMYSQTWPWAKSSSDDPGIGNSVSTDPQGNVFVGGVFGAGSGRTITFGSYSLTSTNYWSLFIAKYDPCGNLLWAKSSAGGPS